MKAISSLVLVLAFAGSIFAQAQAVIVGPKEAPAGELVVLSSTGSVGDNLVWVRPDSIQTVQAGCTIADTQIFFSTIKPGKYEFMLIAADKSAKISFAKHTVVISGSIVEPPPVDPPPVEPPVSNPSKWVKLQDASKANADKLNDAGTRTKLKSSLAAIILAIESKCQAGQCPTLSEAKLQVLGAIETVLLSRSGASALVDWSMWRRGNQVELDRAGIVDTKDYVTAVKAMAAGL